jgi:integrase
MGRAPYIRSRTWADGKTKSYDVRDPGAGGDVHTPSVSFDLKDDAVAYRDKLAVDRREGRSTDRRKRSESLQEYTERWLVHRLVSGKPLTPATLSGYRGLLRRNIYPRHRRTPLGRFSPEVVRELYAEITITAGHDQAAKSYRLIRAILNTAADDGIIPTRPCRIKGGGTEHAAERPLIDTNVVLELAEAIEARYRALVYLAGFGALRTGESLALRRRDINPGRRTVRIVTEAQEISGLGRHLSDPKSEAGKRTVALPKVAIEALEWHLERFTGPEPDAIVFTAVRGGPIRRARLSAAWKAAKAAVGVHPDLQLRPHDLRHHGATLTARKPGITTKELMARIGHSSPRAALRYQHAAEERDQEVADFMDMEIANAERPKRAEIVEIGDRPLKSRHFRAIESVTDKDQVGRI